MISSDLIIAEGEEDILNKVLMVIIFLPSTKLNIIFSEREEIY